MSKEGVDVGRRRFLTLTTSVVGGAGAAAWAWPFLASLRPSERAKALGAPVTVDISKLEPGQKLTQAWRGRPIWVLRRTPEMLEQLKAVPPVELRDPESKEEQQPEYAKNPTRSIKPEILVMTGTCTHLGCSPTFRPDRPAPEIHANWKGGFFCPCHGSMFDLAGRVYTGVPAPLNIAVPPHKYVNDTTIVIGEDDDNKATA
jgi:ubiquinol-cytochrome c reductase iron-sulfur subunit